MDRRIRRTLIFTSVGALAALCLIIYQIVSIANGDVGPNGGNIFSLVVWSIAIVCYLTVLVGLLLARRKRATIAAKDAAEKRLEP